MTEEANAIVLNIINELDKQCVKTTALVQEAMKDYASAVEMKETGAKAKAFTEMKHYVDAYDAIGTAINIFQDVKEGRL